MPRPLSEKASECTSLDQHLTLIWPLSANQRRYGDKRAQTEAEGKVRTPEKDYGFVELLGGADSVVGCDVFGATVSLPKMPKPIVRSRTIRQAAKMPNAKTDLASSLERSRSPDIGPHQLLIREPLRFKHLRHKGSIMRTPTEADAGDRANRVQKHQSSQYCISWKIEITMDVPTLDRGVLPKPSP